MRASRGAYSYSSRGRSNKATGTTTTRRHSPVIRCERSERSAWRAHASRSVRRGVCSVPGEVPVSSKKAKLVGTVWRNFREIFDRGGAWPETERRARQWDDVPRIAPASSFHSSIPVTSKNTVSPYKRRAASGFSVDRLRSRNF